MRKTLIALTALAAFAVPAQAQQAVLMTGPQGGSWYPLGGAMQAMASDAGVASLQVMPSSPSPDGPLSTRSPPMPARLSPQWAMRALTRVPVQLPWPGCTTRPAGLSMTIRWLSSNTMASAMASPWGRAGAGSGREKVRVSPGLTRLFASTIVWPSTMTRPATIRSWKRERLMSAWRRPSSRSSRQPASSSETTRE